MQGDEGVCIQIACLPMIEVPNEDHSDTHQKRIVYYFTMVQSSNKKQTFEMLPSELLFFVLLLRLSFDLEPELYLYKVVFFHKHT